MLFFGLLSFFVLCTFDTSTTLTVPAVLSQCQSGIVPTGQTCATAGGVTVCENGASGSRQVCDKSAAGTNTEVCRNVGVAVSAPTTPTVSHQVCLDACDCAAQAPRCAPLAELDGTTVCQGCLNNADCERWNVAGVVCHLTAVTVNGVEVKAGQCYRPVCFIDSECVDPMTPVCSNPGTSLARCVACAGDSDCASRIGTVCHLTDVTIGSVDVKAGQCYLPVCHINSDCVDPKLPLCSNPGTSLSRCIGCTKNSDCSLRARTICYLTNTIVSGVSIRAGQCHRAVCSADSECVDPETPFCSNSATSQAQCVGCTKDSECTSQVGTVCHLTDVVDGNIPIKAGQCHPPICNINDECTDPKASFCANPGTSKARCVGCHAPEHCSKWPTQPWCTSINTDAPGECAEGCYTDGNCASGFRCLDNACVECISGNDCYSRNQTRPICAADHICVMCTDDVECLSQLPLFEACHIEIDELNVQIKGECVQDTYQKGFQIAALVLGTIGVFLVVIALVIGFVAFMKGD